MWPGAGSCLSRCSGVLMPVGRGSSARRLSGGTMIVVRSARACYSLSATASESAVPCRATMGVVTHMGVMHASVCAPIAPKYMRVVVVEVPYMIVPIDGEHPGSGPPIHGMEEIVGRHEQGILPIVEDAAQIGVAVGEHRAVHIVGGS